MSGEEKTSSESAPPAAAEPEDKTKVEVEKPENVSVEGAEETNRNENTTKPLVSVQTEQKTDDKYEGVEDKNEVEDNKDKVVDKETTDGARGKDEEKDITVTYKLRDFNRNMVQAWRKAFSDYSDDGDRIQISKGDIFKGAPSADALVSPANSFGFMDGGIDMVYTRHFGWQMQHRLQDIIRNEHDGEILVGDAVVMPAYEDEAEKDEMYNEGKPIKYLISAPTMRIPMDVDTTPNAYLAFRAVILAVKKHNRRTDVEPIHSVLCPGMGTAVGQMLFSRCAQQMRIAFETYELGLHAERLKPTSLFHMLKDHEDMCYD